MVACPQVGGLRDTVQQFNPYENTGTGWTFEWADGGNFRYNFSSPAHSHTLGRKKNLLMI